MTVQHLAALETPESITPDQWAAIARVIDFFGWDDADSDVLLMALDIPQLEALHASGANLFSQVAEAISRWICERNSFDFAFCDVLGARLVRVFELGNTRDRANAAVAAFNLGCSHNRWFVMRAFIRMAGPTIDDDLADRLVVEMYTMGERALAYIRQIENALNISRSSLHPKLQQAIATLAKNSSVPDPFQSDFL